MAEGSKQSLLLAGPALAVSLALALIALMTGQLRGRNIGRAALGIAVCFSLWLIYFALFHGDPAWGMSGDYFRIGFLYAIYLTALIVFALFFFHEGYFVRVYWLLARVALVIALAGFLATTLSGRTLLSHTGYGTPRLEGLLGEPSSWAPVVASLMLLANRKGSRGWLGVAVLAAVLTKSPTVYLVCAVSVPMYLAVSSNWNARRVIAVLVGSSLLLAGGVVLSTRDPGPYLSSSNELTVSLGRLMAGLQGLDEGQSGRPNGRLYSTEVALDEVSDNGWTVAGFGLGSSDVYFVAKHGNLRTNSLAVTTFFDLGLVGLSLLVLALMVAISRMRGALSAPLFLPFCVASFVNSAGGLEFYKYSLLAVVVFTLGWRRRSGVAA